MLEIRHIPENKKNARYILVKTNGVYKYFINDFKTLREANTALREHGTGYSIIINNNVRENRGK